MLFSPQNEPPPISVRLLVERWDETPTDKEGEMRCDDRERKPFLTRFLEKVAEEIRLPEKELYKPGDKSDRINEGQEMNRDEQRETL